MGLSGLPTCKGGRVMGSSLAPATPHPCVCVCACDCVLGARAVVARGVRRQLGLLPWDLWGVDWSGGPLARGEPSTCCRLCWNQGPGR